MASAIPCVGAIITDPDGRLLLIKRGHEPEAGRWSLPGGRVEPGESDAEAVVREVREETGLLVTCGKLVGAVSRPAPGDAVLEIRDYAASVTGGALAAGSDAADARWVAPAGLDALPLTTGLLPILAGWGVIQPPDGAGGGQSSSPAPGLAAEATRRAGLIWIKPPAAGRPCPAWHVWHDGAAYLLTGPGEQPLPGLHPGDLVTVLVPSKDSGGLLAAWAGEVSRVEPGTPEWGAVIGQLAAGRLNAAPVPAPAGSSPLAHWAAARTVLRVRPADPGGA